MTYEKQRTLGTIVLDGFYGRRNAGDEAILASIIQQIRSFDSNAEVIVSTFDVEFTRTTHDVDRTIQRFIPSKGLPSKEWLAAIQEADQLWIGGGGLFGDLKMFKYSAQIAIARLFNTRVATVSVGSGPIKSDSFHITSTTLKHVDSITTRDHRSKQFLQESGVTDPVTVVSDPVFGYELDIIVDEPDILENINKDRLLTVSVREPNEYQFDERAFASALDRITKQFDCDVVFLPFHDEPVPDTLVAERVNSYMKSETMICKEPLSFHELFHVISESRLLVGMRLHSIIFAARAKTPFVGIPYAPKCESHLDRLNAESTIWCNSIAQEALVSEISERWESGFSPKTLESINYLEEEVENIIPTIQSQNHAVSRFFLPELFASIGATGLEKIIK